VKRTAIKIGKHVLGLAVVAAVILGVIVAGCSIYAYSRSKAATEIIQAQVTNDGTTHDMTIVWPTGQTQNVTYSETITPKSSTYTGPTNLHKVEIDMISFNPLDSANKAGERLTPSTFAEGDRPAIQVTETGTLASKAEGAQSVGMGGSKPVMGEFLGWGAIALVGLIGLLVIAGVGKWLWAEWKKVSPAVISAAETALHIPKPPTQ
jgi:hypothetical protein